MKTEIKEIYKCEFCNKLYQRKHACLAHELICYKNPSYIRACHSCVILDKVDAIRWSGYTDEFGNECEEKVSVLYCHKRDTYIYPPSVTAKGNAFDLGDKTNIEMPKICEFHKENSWDDDSLSFPLSCR